MNNLTIHAWRKDHLDTAAYTTDAYYLEIAKELFGVLWDDDEGKELEKETAEECAMALAYYFEDVVSGIGVWQAFTAKHKELYGRYLPFYEFANDTYFPDEINGEDVSFILWMYIQKSRKNTMINPENPYILEVSAELYEVLDASFEVAPINETLLDTLKKQAVSDDFFLIKGLFIRLATRSYLFKPFVEGRREAIDEVIDTFLGKDLDARPRAYAFETLLAFQRKIGPLSLCINEWLALMLIQWGLKKEAATIAAIETLPYTILLVENYDVDYLFVKEASGNRYNVLRSAFDGGCNDALLQRNKVLVSSLVQFNGDWMPNGLSVWYESTHLYESFEEEMAKHKKVAEAYRCLRTPTDQSPMRYFASIQGYLDWMKDHFACHENLSAPDDLMECEFPAVYLCEDEGAIFLPNGARIVYDTNNPYYDKAYAQENALAFLLSEEVTPKEMLHYLVDNNMLPDAHINHILGPKRGLSLVQKNLDFLARFMRNDDY